MAGTCRDIHAACEAGQTKEAERFIRTGVDVNKKNDYGETPLHLAAYNGHNVTVKLLLKHRANIEEKDNNGWPPIHRAARKGHKYTVKLLLDHGANIHEKDNFGQTTIHLAEKDGQTDTVKLLLEHGASIDEKDDNGVTPIHRASMKGHSDTVKVLLDHGADIHEKNQYEVTPIHRAAEEGHLDTVKLLLDHGANIHEKDMDGATPMHHAAEYGHTDIVKTLLAAGADPFIARNDGETVRDCDQTGLLMKEVHVDESDFKSCQDFVAKAVKKDKFDLLLNFMERKKAKTLAFWLTRHYMDDFSMSMTFIDFAIRLLGRDEMTDAKKKMLMGGEGQQKVYLVKSDVLEGKSLLQYIVDNGSRMMKQRQDLIDVLARNVKTFDSKGKVLDRKQIKLKRIINDLKLGLPSSRGLAECIKMTEEKFPWTKRKAAGMIAFSIILNLLSLALYFLDVYTDGQFVEEMKKNNFTECFVYSLIHIITPIFWTVLVFALTKNIWKIPFPPITRLVRIYQDTKKFTMRTKDDFEKKVSKVEAEIAEYEGFISLSSGIEAATEAGPQFFFQTVYFLPTLILNPEFEAFASYRMRMLSIVFSFSSVAVTNYFIRNLDKKGALTGASAAALLVRVTLSCVSRVLIFSSWMFVTFEKFHPTATISAFYFTLFIMIIFNMVFNKSRSADILTFKYWIDIAMNSYSCVLTYNQNDYQAMLDKEYKKNKKKYHESTMIRQIIYFLIFVLLLLSLSILTVMNIREKMKVKVQGKEHDLSQLQVIIMLAVGWACFLGSWLTNIAYYSFHPSAVEIFSLSEKMKLFMIGRDVCSLGKKNPPLQDEVEGGTEVDTVGLTGDHNEESSCSWLSCCNLTTEDSTNTPEAQLTTVVTFKTDTEDDALQMRVGVLQRKVDHTEKKIKRLTKQKTLAEETINTLTEGAKISEKRAEAESAEYKLKVETLESEIARLREELFKKA